MNPDRVTSIFWLCVSLIVSIASFRLGLGRVTEPGSGFMPFGASILLAILSSVCFLQAKESRKPGGVEPLFLGKFWLKVVVVFAVLFFYALLMPHMGYIVATFLLLIVLFWIAGEKKVWKVTSYSFITTVLTYFVFSKWLNLQFPIGPLGF